MHWTQNILCTGCISLTILAFAAGQSVVDAPNSIPSTHELASIKGLCSGIEDEAAPELLRVDQALRLILLRTEAASSSILGLLTSPKSPSSLAILTQAIQEAGQTHPRALDPRWMGPLSSLMKNPPDDLTRLAAQALASFSDQEAEALLVNAAADRSKPEEYRVIVLEALGRNIDRRSVVQSLIGMLQQDDPLVPLVLNMLRPASRLDFGNNIEAWRAWWEQENKLSDAEWLASRLELRNLETKQALTRLAAAEQAHLRLDEQYRREMEEALREVYRLTAEEPDREKLLASWLNHESPRYRVMAATLIKERIPDRLLPTETLHAELRNRIGDSSAEVRRTVLSILGAIRDPTDFDTVVAALKVERDHEVREAVFRTLGQFQDPRAIPMIMTELKHSKLEAAEDAEALLALGSLLQKIKPERVSQLSGLTAFLRERMSALPPNALRRKRGILICMAACPDPAFTDDFQSALGQDAPDLLVPAIEGMLALKDQTSLDRLVQLLRHQDPEVRKSAATAVCALTTDSKQVEAVLRLSDSGLEPVEVVRESAWNAVNTWLGLRPPEEQWNWVDRIPEPKERQVDYLLRLTLTTAGQTELETIHVAAQRKLAEKLDALNRPQESMIHWLKVYNYETARQQPTAVATGFTLFHALVNSENVEAVSDFLCPFAEAAPPEARAKMMEIVLARVARLRNEGRESQADALMALFASDSDLPCRHLWTLTKEPEPTAEVQPPQPE